MKSLIVAESWILKALDNLEEIKPDIILISVSDYPRQWKAFVEYAYTILKNASPIVYIISAETIPEKDIQDAKILNCQQISETTFTNIELKNKTENIETDRKNLDAQEVNLNNFTFKHPKTGAIISGSIKNYNDPMFVFIPDLESDINLLRFGLRINNATFSLGTQKLDTNVQVQGINKDSIEMCILGKNKKK